MGKKKLNRVVVGEGETVGHKHVVEGPGVKFDEKESVLYATDGSKISHEEHKSFDVPAGDWVVDHVKEYDYDTEEKRSVVD